MEAESQQMTIYAGRHHGWWIEWRTRSGRRFMWTWWRTKGLATMVTRLWVRLARRFGTAVSVTERDSGATAERT